AAFLDLRAPLRAYNPSDCDHVVKRSLLANTTLRRCGPMSRFSGGMRTLRISGWMGAFALLCAILVRIAQAAPQATPSPAAPDSIPATIEFNRDIRPILSDKCFQCHGPASQMATLRFDLEDGAKHALSGGRFAIVPG